jgi:CubicO group peptidase (beta-lactamase class C family)
MKIDICLAGHWDRIKILMFSFAILVFSTAEAQKVRPISNLYFPPVESSVWEKTPLAELGWNQEELGKLLSWLQSQDTRAFLILKDGKMVVEEYWGEKLTGTGQMDQNSYWYWESAGKTLTAGLVGIAEQEKLLKIGDRTDKYLGVGWTSMAPNQEKKIKLIHQLTLTTGIDDKVQNLDDISPASLKYLAKPGERWSYHNATYTLLEKVVEKATSRNFQAYFEEKIGKPIGMKGIWQKTGLNNVFYSDARSFARFGLLLLAGGNWNGKQVWSGDYFSKLSQSSQNLNLSYGYLTWLNGKNSYMVPGSQAVLPGTLIPQAPSDMYLAIGKSGQFLMVIPSLNLVVVRMGSAASESPVPFVLLRNFWERMDRVLP